MEMVDQTRKFNFIKYVINEIKKKLKSVAKDKDVTLILENLQNFFEALGPLEEKSIASPIELSKSKEKLFEYEKIYLPFFEENRDISEQLKPDNLIMTVGLQSEPLILSILCLKPKKVFLLYSEESRKNAEEVSNDPDVKKLNIKISFVEITEYDATKNYAIMKEILDKLTKNSRTVIDPTGGRKIMISSLSLVAFYYRLPIVYMHGLDVKGKIIPFSEMLRRIENPFEYYGDIELQLVEELFNSHFYEAAVKMCGKLLKSTKDLATSKKIELVMELISIYRDWDAFLHSAVHKKPEVTLSERLEDAVKEFKRFRICTWLPEGFEKNIEFLKQIDKRWKNKYNIVDEFRLVDVYLSALRRGSEKQAKYDDAIARLYRCIEMSATFKLYSKGIKSTEYPDFESFVINLGFTKQELKDRFAKLQRRNLPDEKLGLDNQMSLLKIMDENDRIVRIYESMKDLIKTRNRSILAHGTYSATEKDWINFRNKTKQILIELLGEKRFDELLNMGWHGKIVFNTIIQS
ncbi:MAG: TIGR02710 family CRISPR-associated CARF protein [archaeon]